MYWAPFPNNGCLQIKLMGTRENAADQDFSGIPLEEEEESHLKDAAVISMGTEISAEDMMNIEALCDQVLLLCLLSTASTNHLRQHCVFSWHVAAMGGY